MPKYGLGAVKGKTVKEIDLDSILKLGNNQLEKLDSFTMEFKDESELKAYLLKKGILQIGDEQNKFKVIYTFKGTKKLDILYSDLKAYMDSYYLHSMLRILTKNDLVFLKKLRNHYDNGSTTFNKQGLNIHDIDVYLSDVRSGGGKLFDSKLLDTAIDDLFLKASFRPIDVETGEAKEDYRGYRDLATFVYKYKKKSEELDVTEEVQQISIDEVSKKCKTVEPFTPQVFEGEQLSLFNKTHVEEMKKSEEKQKIKKMFIDLGKQGNN